MLRGAGQNVVSIHGAQPADPETRARLTRVPRRRASTGRFALKWCSALRAAVQPSEEATAI
jgi:hypothetical protein